MHEQAQARASRIVEDLVSSSKELGIQIAAYLDGELVVDAWGGLADASTGRPMTPDTLCHAFSAGKVATATIVHMLADRKLLRCSDPVALHWPAFAAHGKERVTVAHVLTHTAGVPYFPEGIVEGDLGDWDAVCARIADLAPQWPPGAQAGYHGLTFGYILGEVVRRVTGRPIEQWLRTELAGPLGIPDDLFFGVPDAHAGRLAMLDDAEFQSAMSRVPADAPFRRVAPAVLAPRADFATKGCLRRAIVPSGIVMTARAGARLMALWAGRGTLDGMALLSQGRVDEAIRIRVAGVDAITGSPSAKALGFVVGETPMAGSAAFGMRGAGGSLVFADCGTRFAFALTKNRMDVSPWDSGSAAVLAAEICSALELGQGRGAGA